MNFTGVKAPEPPKTVHQYKSITDYMTRDVYTLSADQSIAEAMDMFLEKKISGAPVVNERGRIVGILSEIDCMRILVDEAYFNLPHGKITVAKYMSEKVQTLSETMDVLDCAQKFLDTNFRRFPVVDVNDRLVGTISRRDIMRATRDMKTSTW